MITWRPRCFAHNDDFSSDVFGASGDAVTDLNRERIPDPLAMPENFSLAYRSAYLSQHLADRDLPPGIETGGDRWKRRN